MKEWQQYWNRPSLVENQDPLKQVGKTVNGIPIAKEQFAAIVTDIRQRLTLHSEDVVLDLCCGNGAVTYEIARYCRQVVGVDFSEPLIHTARARFQSPNSEYVIADVCVLPVNILRRSFTNIYMYEALQHFGTEQLDALLCQLSSLPAPRLTMYFGSVPDAGRIRNFYNTPDRWAEYERRLTDNSEAIGHWWTRDELTAVLHEHGYGVNFLQQISVMHGAHYRFDALCTPLGRK